MCGNSQRKKWSSLVPPLSKQNMTHTFDYFYLLHQWKSDLTGHHYKDSICLTESTRSCATNIQILAIENARPYFYTLADGYLGLGADLGWNKKEGKRLNFIDQMHEHGVIKEKTFGIHTKLYNATALESKPSEIRIGGINHDLLSEGRMLAYFDTVSKNTWEIPLKNIHFHD